MSLLVSPIMAAWARTSVASRPVPLLPSDAPFATEPGPDPDRVLLLGSGAAAGIGVRTHALGLTGALARALAERTGRGATVETLAKPNCPLGDVPELIGSTRLSRYDTVVIVAGMADALALQPRRAWLQSLTSVLDWIQSEAARDTSVIVLGIPQVSAVSAYRGWQAKVADRHAEALNRAARSIAESRDRVHYLPVAAPPSDERGAFTAWYDTIATQLATVLEPLLAVGADRPVAARAARAAPDAEALRLAALADSGLAPRELDSRFDRIAGLAHELLGGDIALVGFIDEDTQWYTSIIGADLTEVPRSYAICNRTIQSDGPYVVGDLHAEPAYDDNPFVHGESPLHFYAGFPIESADGYRIGSICVVGTEPRDPSTVDLTALARLAAMARAQVWESGRTGTAPAPVGFRPQPIPVD